MVAAGVESFANLLLWDIVATPEYARSHPRYMKLSIAQSAIPHAYPQSVGVCLRQQTGDGCAAKGRFEVEIAPSLDRALESLPADFPSSGVCLIEPHSWVGRQQLTRFCVGVIERRLSSFELCAADAALTCSVGASQNGDRGHRISYALQPRRRRGPVPPDWRRTGLRRQPPTEASAFAQPSHRSGD